MIASDVEVLAVTLHDQRLLTQARALSRSAQVALDRSATRLQSIVDRSRRASQASLDAAGRRLDGHRGRMTGAARSHLRTAEVHIAAGERRIAHRAPRALSEADRSIAAPVRDRMGRVVASVSVAEHVDDVDAGLRHLAGPVIETAKRVSAGLGWTW